jgi:hypothetical protein
MRKETNVVVWTLLSSCRCPFVVSSLIFVVVVPRPCPVHSEVRK